jgi:hypothetical protein
VFDHIRAVDPQTPMHVVPRRFPENAKHSQPNYYPRPRIARFPSKSSESLAVRNTPSQSRKKKKMTQTMRPQQPGRHKTTNEIREAAAIAIPGYNLMHVIVVCMFLPCPLPTPPLVKRRKATSDSPFASPSTNTLTTLFARCQFAPAHR